MDWAVIQDYATTEIDYAEETQQRLFNVLGFEPHFKAVCATEVYARKALKRFKNGETTEADLKKQFEAYAEVIKTRILKDVPEQAHLIDQETVDAFNANQWHHR